MGLPPAPKDADRARRREGPTKHEGRGAPGLSPGLGLAVRSAVVIGNGRQPRTSTLRVRAPDAGRGVPPSQTPQVSAELSVVPAG